MQKNLKKRERSISHIYVSYFKKFPRSYSNFFKFTVPEYKFCNKGNLCETYKNLSQNFSY